MKALVKKKPMIGLWMEEVERPVLGPNDLLIRVLKTAICGTDLHIYNWDDWAQRTLPIPLVVGHEFFGVVEEVGSAVGGFVVGDRVSGEGHLTCGYCRNCRAGRRHLCRNTKGIGIHTNGCFAEFLKLPAENAFRIASDVSDEIASFFDPLGNAVHTALSFDLVGEDVLITGAGPIGVMAAAICKLVGARHVVVTDVNEYRLELAKKMGATLAVNAQKQNLRDVMKSLRMQEGFDVGLEMSGNPSAFRDMLEVMNHGGRLAILGIFSEPVSIDWSQVIFKGLQMKGIYGREMYETWYKMQSLLQSGLDVAPVVTHRFAAEDYQKAFETVRSGHSGKVILEWGNA
ncbi:MAG: L-threonine 3-dehydrogenase [Bdellovibrionales bacterium]|nr:L-threonine 3-dehydrogenase [Bdellovibrionales bacterium]